MRMRSGSLIGLDVLSRSALVGRRIMLVAAAHLQNLDPEGLQPGQQPLQCGLVPERPVHDSADWLDGGIEPVEVEQNLGRQNASYTDLVVRG
jgi:hypothetical protein